MVLEEEETINILKGIIKVRLFGDLRFREVSAENLVKGAGELAKKFDVEKQEALDLSKTILTEYLEEKLKEIAKASFSKEAR